MRSETLKMATPVRRKKKAEPASAAADQKLSGAAVDEARNEPPKAAAPVRRSRKADQKSRPSAERKPSRAGMETRTRLLDTAERVFAELGYEGASLRVIADHANLGRDLRIVTGYTRAVIRTTRRHVTTLATDRLYSHGRRTTLFFSLLSLCKI